ncbi:MAG: class I SAM-dependent methyltransferase [Thermoproteota archaeon]|nr:class I SAM-dependent methyltransferase [Thermoproteota archaeon]
MSYTHSLSEARAENHALVLATIIQNRRPNAALGLDVGAGQGKIALKLSEKTGISFIGLEPHLPMNRTITGYLTIMKGFANQIPFDNETFDVVTLVSVYEHLLPAERLASLKEINRVLKDKGIVAGQIPNMYFPIELHSKLPFQTYLPKPLAEWYLKKFSTVPWKHKGMNWYRVGQRQLKNECSKAGFVKMEIRKADYPSEVIPCRFGWAIFLLHLFPLGYYFCFRKEHTA